MPTFATPAVADDATVAQPAGPVQWNLEALDKAPHFTDAPISEPGVRGIFYDALPWKGKPTRVFAWLGLPDRPLKNGTGSEQPPAAPEGNRNREVPVPNFQHAANVGVGDKVPAMVLVHGGGGTPRALGSSLWNQRAGYAAIAMDTCGAGLAANEPDQKRLDDGGPRGWDKSFEQIDLPIEDQWAYHAVADIVLAHSLLRSLAEVDAEKIGLTGISWGGYLTCLAAGIDQRFKFAAPVYGCGYLGVESAWKRRRSKSLVSRVGRKMARGSWDPSVYLPQAKMPMLWVSGDVDFYYRLGPLQKSYRLPPGKHYLAIRYAMPHGHPSGKSARNPGVRQTDELARRAFGPNDRPGNGWPAQAWGQFAAALPTAQIATSLDQGLGSMAQREWTVADTDLDKETGRVTGRTA